jgi:hypothetical protein
LAGEEKLSKLLAWRRSLAWLGLKNDQLLKLIAAYKSFPLLPNFIISVQSFD